VAAQLDVRAELDFAVEVPGREPLTGSLRGAGRTLELRVSDPAAFAGRADSAAVRSHADAMGSRGIRVTVGTGD
jgi:hypothetical protein